MLYDLFYVFLAAGFNRVFPLERLHAFKAHEIRLMLCGEQTPNWSYDELIMYTEPKYGYHKDSPGFIRLINVLTAMTGEERKVTFLFAFITLIQRKSSFKAQNVFLLLLLFIYNRISFVFSGNHFKYSIFFDFCRFFHRFI